MGGRMDLYGLKGGLVKRCREMRKKYEIKQGSEHRKQQKEQNKIEVEMKRNEQQRRRARRTCGERKEKDKRKSKNRTVSSITTQGGCDS